MANKVDIRADVMKNRLYLILAGFFDDSEMTGVADKCIAEVKKLKPGFDIINDISQCKSASDKGILELMRAQTFIKQSGVNKVVRITGDIITQAQFSRQGKEAGYDALTAASIADAEKMLVVK
jgi:hypothetical protein